LKIDEVKVSLHTVLDSSKTFKYNYISGYTTNC
jgi:hypothetical protein